VRPDDADRDLRELFARLKESDRAAAPLFQTVLGDAERRRRSQEQGTVRRIAAIAAAIVLLAGGALAVLYDRLDPRRPESAGTVVTVDLRSTWWQAPTDFLLDTPGDRLLRTVPTLGRADDWGLAPARTQRSTPNRLGRPERNTS
jgi:hypothetical protein